MPVTVSRHSNLLDGPVKRLAHDCGLAVERRLPNGWSRVYSVAMSASGNIGIALGLTLLAGLSTGIGSAIAYFIKRPKIVYLAFALGLSGGVMIWKPCGGGLALTTTFSGGGCTGGGGVSGGLRKTIVVSITMSFTTSAAPCVALMAPTMSTPCSASDTTCWPRVF